MQRQFAAHHIEDEPMEDASPATASAPRAFRAAQAQLTPVEQEFFHMTSSHAISPAPFLMHAGNSSSSPRSDTSKQHLVRQVSVPISESSSVVRDGNDTQDELAAQLAAALAANAKLQSKLNIQSAHAHRLEEKVVSQGQTVSALCVEVDRLTKDKEELNERLTMQMEQRKIETEQFRHHLTMFKATSNGQGMSYHQTHNVYGNQTRMSLTGSPYQPTKFAAVAPATAPSPVRRMSTAMGASSTISCARGHTVNGTPQQTCRFPPRRMSTGAAATCS